MFDGKPVAKWIIPELTWARRHGWHGQVTSGWRSPNQVVHGAFATAPQGQSEHKGTRYPHGAVDVSDYGQFEGVIRGYRGPRRLIQLGIDPLHFSGTGHARGGFVGMSRGGRHHRHHRHAPRHIRKRNPWTFKMQRHTAKNWRRIEGQYHTWLRGQRKPTFDQRLAQVDLGAARAAATTPSTQDDRGVARQRVTLLSGHLTGQRRRERTIRHHLNQHLSGNTRKRLKGELDQLTQDEAQTVSDLHDARGVTSQGALDQLSGAEDLVDLHQQAGDITDDQAAKQKQALEGGALRGVYGKLSAHDRLTVRAEQHQAQTAAQSSLQQSIQALADELKTQNALNAKVNAVSSQAIFRALGAVVSGQIGGTTQVRSRSPGDGRSAIYI